METTFHRYKAILGSAMRARGLASQRVEVRLGCKILNTMTALGIPDGEMNRMTGRRSHGRLSALNGVVHQGKLLRTSAASLQQQPNYREHALKQIVDVMRIHDGDLIDLGVADHECVSDLRQLARFPLKPLAQRRFGDRFVEKPAGTFPFVAPRFKSLQALPRVP